MRDPILYFLLLVLQILLNLCPNASFEQGGFSKTLLQKSFEFDASKRNGIVAFNLSFILLLVEVNLVSEKQSHKRDAFVANSSGHVKIILI